MITKSRFEKVEHDRKQNWGVFDSVTEMAYTTIKMVKKKRYHRGDKRYLYMQYKLEKCHADLDKIYPKEDDDLRELKKDLADEIAENLEVLDARAFTEINGNQGWRHGRGW